MEKSFRVNILTPEKNIFEGEIVSLIVPAALGYLGILADHAPLAASLKAGKIIFRGNTGEQTVLYNKNRGFLEVAENKVTVLLDSA
ncbi:MAG: ATP synthase F1 subunit epsilon [Candidatus Omnitrophota bacterium]|jgi:F-type H+-transporting ATPase subunit epsilon|nr:ATP synthase F1 subunit epsilon [Candidatus Omnitrophota bacterium]MDD5517925.1 ATP synthase F1 subunit epsilon [Candidatus Omnitrophota bacterium]